MRLKQILAGITLNEVTRITDRRNCRIREFTARGILERKQARLSIFQPRHSSLRRTCSARSYAIMMDVVFVFWWEDSRLAKASVTASTQSNAFEKPRQRTKISPIIVSRCPNRRPAVRSGVPKLPEVTVHLGRAPEAVHSFAHPTKMQRW